MIAVGQAVRRCNRGAQSIDVRYAPIVLNKSVFGGGWRRGRMRTSGLGRVYPVIAGWVIGIILAILRRFWAVAARRNSYFAPFGPLRRRRLSFRMRLKCANSISIFFRSRREGG